MYLYNNARQADPYKNRRGVMILEIFEGCCTALVTPFEKCGDVDKMSLEKLVEFNIEGGADALLSCGTTGENACLSDEEHIEVMRFTLEKARGRVPVICSTGSNNTEHAVYMSRRAFLMGASALLLITPYYNRCSKEGLYRHFERIAKSVELPCIVYNVPGRTGVDITSDDFARLLTIKNIVGIKEASGDIEKARKMAAASGKRASVFSGNDDLTIPIIKNGGRGVISVLSNIVPGEVKRITELSLQGKFKEAEEIYKRYARLTELLFEEVNPIPVKYCLQLMGLIEANYRLPLCEPNEELKKKLKEEMIAGGIIND